MRRESALATKLRAATAWGAWMLYWLIDLSNTVPGMGVFRSFLNVFRYITFRTGEAMVTGASFVSLFGLWIIDHLRLRQGKGPPIRNDGQRSHLVSEKGT